MDDADLIWNRACDVEFKPTRPGDTALKEIVSFHSLSMNGGIAHALELDYTTSARVAAHYRRFGADEQAALIDEARQLAAPGVGAGGTFDSLSLPDDEADALDALDARLPDDSDVIAVFRRYLSAHPEDFDRP